jgi:hypothetical protein
MSNGEGRDLSEFKSKHAPDPETIALRKKVKDLERELLKNKAATGVALELINDVREELVIAAPPTIKYKPKKGSETPITHVLHLTDWHYGGVIEPDEIDGFGRYNPDIAVQRLEQLGQLIIDKTKTQRKGYKVPNLHIIGTGDYISGDIHRELSVTNAFPCPVQAVRCGYAMGRLFEMLAPHFEKVEADLITLDNHGRLTVRNQASQGGMNNWGYVVCSVAQQYMSKAKNMEVRVHAKPQALIPIGSEAYLAFHGHQIKGWAGKPYYGFDRRVAMEAVKRAGYPEQAFTKLLMGHFHHGMNGDTWILGGSLSGTDAFDHSCGRFGKPHQLSWFVHPKHGEFDWTRWWLD